MQNKSALKKRKTEIREREEEATSEETLEELEKKTGSDSDQPDQRIPSPDGAMDQDDELSDAGPM
jgi:hypothetical protein